MLDRVTTPTGLRDQKKAATRDALGIAAVRLGKEHGLDAVTAEDIMAALQRGIAWSGFLANPIQS